MRIALLEDDQDQADLLQLWLKSAGHSSEHFVSGRVFVRTVRHDSFDALILDWMVPDMDGYEVLGWVRETFNWPIPVLFLTARDDEDDIVRALELGADDYMLKPAKQREFLARLQAVVRRTTPVDPAQQTLDLPPFLVDLAKREIRRDGQLLEITQKEYELSIFLFRNLGRVMSRPHILESVWGRNPAINTRTVDTHISRIRSKLGLLPEYGWRLNSIYQHGYRLERLPAA